MIINLEPEVLDEVIESLNHSLRVVARNVRESVGTRRHEANVAQYERLVAASDECRDAQAAALTNT